VNQVSCGSSLASPWTDTIEWRLSRSRRFLSPKIKSISPKELTMTAANPPFPESPATQKYLGPTGLIVLIALLSAFVPLSTDLYLPALPGMSAFFHAPADQINLTLTAFFVVYGLGTLLWGPLCDRYGRKPVLLIGLGIYVLASLMCAGAWNVAALVFFRCLQAAGGSASGVVATAVVKDVYTGRKRESALAVVQSMVLISPAVAPVIGALLLGVTSWRGTFWLLTGIGVVALLGSLALTETIPARSAGPVFENLSRLGSVLQNRGFALLLLVFSIGAVSTLAFIASSTFIYQNGFHLSGRVYSYYFSLNALGMIAGPMIYLRLSRRWHSETIIRVCFLTIAASGVLVCLLGNRAPWIFALCILPSAVAGSGSRPPAANMMLEQQKGDTGSVSSIIGCTGTLMGSLGMQLISLPWGNTILALGVMTFLTSTVSLLLWPLAIRHAKRLPGPQAVWGKLTESTAD
jgi:MFS transporter, DHA1 family, multidrug resistance protein